MLRLRIPQRYYTGELSREIRALRFIEAATYLELPEGWFMLPYSDNSAGVFDHLRRLRIWQTMAPLDLEFMPRYSYLIAVCNEQGGRERYANATHYGILIQKIQPIVGDKLVDGVTRETILVVALSSLDKNLSSDGIGESLRQKRQAAESWLDSHYPNWCDPLAYWGENE